MTIGRGGERGEREPRPAVLLGELVVFTGRLATMTRGRAARVVELAGGRVAAAVTPRATMLVIGALGLPLLESGRLPRSIERAEALRAAGGKMRILTERTFRELVGLDESGEAERGGKSLEASQVAAALGVEAGTLERWAHLGLVRPHEGRYDFRDLVSLRTVTELVARGASPLAIQHSLEGLTGVLPGVDRPLAQLKILVSDKGRLVAELEDALLAPGGQLELKFERGTVDDRPDLAWRAGEAQGHDAAWWIAAGLAHEDSRRRDEAESAYRRAVEIDPSDPVAHLNLGNVLLASGNTRGAAERFLEAATLDPDSARAWYNLAYVLDELGHRPEALRSLRRAVAADPGFPDAHYNLAELSERMGLRGEAARSWAAYLRLDPIGEWAREARRRLAALQARGGSPAWA